MSSGDPLMFEDISKISFYEPPTTAFRGETGFIIYCTFLAPIESLNLHLFSSECIRKAFSKEQYVHMLYCRSLEYLFAKLLFLVTLLFAKERFREEYRSDWSKETRILKDNFYSILRTIYRNKFGANFIRVVVNGFSKYSTGELVVNTAVLLQPHPDNFGDLLQLWSDQVSRRPSHQSPVKCNL